MRTSVFAALAAAVCFVMPAAVRAEPVVVASTGTFAAIPPDVRAWSRRAVSCLRGTSGAACTATDGVRSEPPRPRFAATGVPQASTVVSDAPRSVFARYADALRAGGWREDPAVGSDDARAQMFAATLGGHRFVALLTLYRTRHGEFAQACAITDLGVAEERRTDWFGLRPSGVTARP